MPFTFSPNPCPAPWFLHGVGLLLLSMVTLAIARLNTPFTIHGSCKRDQVQGRGCLDLVHADLGGVTRSGSGSIETYLLKFSHVLEKKCTCIWICGGTTYAIPVFKIGTKENAVSKSRCAKKMNGIKTYA